MLRTNGVLGFRYSKQLCLCVIELHMGVNIQRHADVRMTHDILQCLWIHSGFRHIGTEGVSAYMRGYFGHLDAVDLVVLLDNVLHIFLPVQCNHRSVVFVQEQEPGVSIHHRLCLRCGVV